MWHDLAVIAAICVMVWTLLLCIGAGAEASLRLASQMTAAQGAIAMTQSLFWPMWLVMELDKVCEGQRPITPRYCTVPGSLLVAGAAAAFQIGWFCLLRAVWMLACRCRREHRD
jgi:hypothetical protein